MTTPRTLTPGITPDIRPPAGHALLIERDGETITASCECGVLFGRGNPATSLDRVGSAWERHLAACDG